MRLPIGNNAKQQRFSRRLSTLMTFVGVAGVERERNRRMTDREGRCRKLNVVLAVTKCIVF